MEWRDLVSARRVGSVTVPAQGRGCYERAFAQLVRYRCQHGGKDVRTVHATNSAGEELGGERCGGGGGDVDRGLVLGVGGAEVWV